MYKDIEKKRAYDIRPATGDDIPFIYSTWLKSYKHDSKVGLSTTNTVFFKEYECILDYILAQPDTKVSVACKIDEPNVIYGYMVSQPSVLHYVFVKEAFQGLRIASNLYADAFGQGNATVTHVTLSTHSLFKKFPQLTYNPFLLYRTTKE